MQDRPNLAKPVVWRNQWQKKGNPRNYSSGESREIFWGKLYDQDGSRFKLWSDYLILNGFRSQKILIITGVPRSLFSRIHQENKDECMGYAHDILRMKELLTRTLGQDRSWRGRLKNLKTTGRRRSGNVKIQRDLKNWKRKSPSGKESPLYIKYVISELTVKIEFEILILWLIFDLETWRQSQNGAWRVMWYRRDVDGISTQVLQATHRRMTRIRWIP